MAQAPEGTSSAKRDTRDIVRLVLLGVLILLLLGFIIGNSNSVKVDFIFFHANASLIWVIIISVLLGVLLDRLSIVLAKRRKSRT